jgi:hypothetical protein
MTFFLEELKSERHFKRFDLLHSCANFRPFHVPLPTAGQIPIRLSPDENNHPPHDLSS